MSHSRPCCLTGFALLAALAASAHADVIIVEPSSPDPLLELQQAIDAAQDGDIVLVRPGEYVGPDFDSVLVVDKGISLVADRGAARPILRRLRVEQLDSQDTFILQGFHIGTPAFNSYQESWTASVQDCLGTVRLEDCVVDPGPSPPGGFGVYWPGKTALLVSGSTDVTALRMSLTAGEGGYETCCGLGSSQAGPGGIGCAIEQSTVALYDSVITGGIGGLGLGGTAWFGGSGIEADGAQLFLASSAVLGGDSKGNGLIADASSAIHSVQSTFVASAFGQGVLGDVTELVGTARTLRIPSPAREGESLLIEIEGEPGELAGLFYSPHPGAGVHTLLPGNLGVFQLASPFAGPEILGVVRPDGRLEIPVIAPRLDPLSADGRTFLVQLITATDTQVVVGQPGAFVLLDDSIP